MFHTCRQLFYNSDCCGKQTVRDCHVGQPLSANNPGRKLYVGMHLPSLIMLVIFAKKMMFRPKFVYRVTLKKFKIDLKKKKN